MGIHTMQGLAVKTINSLQLQIWETEDEHPLTYV